MRKLVLSIAGSAALVFAMVVPVLAAPPAMELPAAACNQGTMNAHESVPETTGTGVMTPGHVAIPESEEGGPCSHGGE
jgi:hypothetical protein